MDLRHVLTTIVAAGALVLGVGAAPAQASSSPKPSLLQVEQALRNLGLPVGTVDGKITAYSKRALCAWRHMQGKPASRAWPTDSERKAIVAAKRLPYPRDFMVTGLNVHQTCQSMFWVRGGSGTRYYAGVFGISSGTASHPTRIGTFRINRQHDRWVESNIYSGAWMYRPKFFSGGMALHGSRSDALIMPYPASHGCVRMYHADINRLWSSGVGVGTKVKVYGQF